MKWKVAISVLLGALVLGGCGAETSARTAAPDNSTALLATKLPAVKSIEKWQNKYGSGLVIETEHYRLTTTLSDLLTLRMLPAFLETAYSGYQRELPERVDTAIKFDIYLFENRWQWEDFTASFAGSHAALYNKIQKGAYYLNGACVAYYIGRNETYAAIGHEGWHQFCSRHFAYRLPSWLDEGIATLFETGSYRGTEWVFEPQRNLGRLAGMKKTLQNGNVIKLRQLVALNPGEVIGGMNGTVAFYSQSYELVRFLREEQYGRRLNDYHAMLLGGLRGTWELTPEARRMASDRNIPLTVQWNQYLGPMLFERYIGGNWEQLEAEYLNYCRKTTYNIQLKEPIPADMEGGR